MSAENLELKKGNFNKGQKEFRDVYRSNLKGF